MLTLLKYAPIEERIDTYSARSQTSFKNLALANLCMNLHIKSTVETCQILSHLISASGCTLLSYNFLHWYHSGFPLQYCKIYIFVFCLFTYYGYYLLDKFSNSCQMVEIIVNLSWFLFRFGLKVYGEIKVFAKLT